MGRRDPLTGAAVGPTQRLGKGGSPKAFGGKAGGGKLIGTRKPSRRELLNELLKKGNVTAKCGDGCLDRLVVSIRHRRAHTLPVIGGTLALPIGSEPESGRLHKGKGGAGAALWPPTESAAPTPLPRHGLPLLLLGLLSGSAPRREVLRCTWMRNPVLAEGGVRVLFVVGKESAEDSPDVLAVDVKEGAFMRSKNDKDNRTRTFDPKKLIRTGSVTTYWKLVEVCVQQQPLPMPACHARPWPLISLFVCATHARSGSSTLRCSPSR